MLLQQNDLLEVFKQKYGDPATTGQNPRRRYRYSHFSPDDYYEATVEKLVTPGCRWLDVGGGRDIFPRNMILSKKLSERCGHLVGVDPSENIHENPYVHDRAQAFIEDYKSDEPFDLLTMRMVAEHITKPQEAVANMARLLKPGGRMVLYTVNKFAPVSMAAWIIPFWLHHPIKALIWQTEEKDTFPVAYLMNTRSALNKLAQANGFTEESFAYLDDCRTFYRYKFLNHCELLTWSCLRSLGLNYPENCLMGVYRKS